MTRGGLVVTAPRSRALLQTGLDSAVVAVAGSEGDDGRKAPTARTGVDTSDVRGAHTEVRHVIPPDVVLMSSSTVRRAAIERAAALAFVRDATHAVRTCDVVLCLVAWLAREHPRHAVGVVGSLRDVARAAAVRGARLRRADGLRPMAPAMTRSWR
jgi:hypothetical protein